MIKITKKQEPSKLLKYRKNKDATYNNMPKDVHDAVLESLMQEQGYLCAYCMSKIPQKGKIPPVTIEHINAQSTTVDNALDYNNMLAVCNGSRGCGSKNSMTCDAHRANTPLTVNPLIPSTLSNVQYKADGVIFFFFLLIEKDLNETLNLNCSQAHLIENRKKALEKMLVEINKK